jgi:hypothetical protein
MFTTVEGIYKDGNIELSELPAGMGQSKVLVTFLPTTAATKQPLVLYGAWKDQMPADFDIDAALNEIRGEWTREWENGEHE